MTPVVKTAQTEKSFYHPFRCLLTKQFFVDDFLQENLFQNVFFEKISIQVIHAVLLMLNTFVSIALFATAAYCIVRVGLSN